MAYTTDDLVTSVRRRGQLPSASADGKLTDADILALADEEIQTLIYPLVTNARSEYWVKGATSAIVADQEGYRIPQRATAGGLRDVLYQAADGSRSSLPQISLEESWAYRAGGQGMAFTVAADFVGILPTPTSATGSVFFFYTRQHSRCVAVAACAKVTGIASNVYTCDSVPATWSTSTDLDAFQAVPNFDALSDDETPDAVVTGASGTVTLDGAVTDFAVGDYLALAGETCVLQIPRELHPLLVSAVLVRVYEAIGDSQGAQLTMALMERKERAADLIDPRVHGAPKRIINRHSALRGGNRRGGY